MPYIGRGPAKSGAFRILDDVSGSFNGSTVTFALTVASTALTVGLPETLIIAVDGVIQEPGSAYTISGSNIVFGSAPQEAATFWGVELGDVGGIAQQAVTQSTSDNSTSIATTAYVDNQIDVQLTAEDLDVTGDSGTIAIDLDSEVLAITGGTGITTTASGSAVNIVGHADAHTVASHSDTTGTGAELETLTDGSNAESLHTHTHTVVSHSDTTATGAELNIIDGDTSATGTTIADADRVVLNDNGTMVQVAVTDLKTYIGSGAVTLEGGNTTEATMTSATVTDLLQETTLSIAATRPITAFVLARASDGDNGLCIGLAVNNTTIFEAQSGVSSGIWLSASSGAQEGFAYIVVPPRITSYDDVFMDFFCNYGGDVAQIHGDFVSALTHIKNKNGTMPTAEVADFDIRGDSDGSATLGADELQIYSFAAS